MILARWKPESSSAKLKITYNKVRITGERHDYILEFFVENTGSIRIEEYALDLSFPSAFLNQDSIHSHEIDGRRTTTHRYFRVTEQHYPNKAIFPGDTQRVFALNYFVDHGLYMDNTAMGQSFVAASLRSGTAESTGARHSRLPDFLTTKPGSCRVGTSRSSSF